MKKNGGAVSRAARIALFIFFAFGSAPDAFCQVPPDSMLGKFEKSVQPPPDKPAKPQPAPEHSRDKNNNNGDNHSFLGDLVSDMVSDMLKPGPNQQTDSDTVSVAPGEDSTMKRLDPRTDISLRRDDGDILIPFVRYDFAYQNITSTINASSNRLEAGYGSYGLLLEHYVFQESNPSASLTIDRQIFLFRLSADRTTELDLGLGESVVIGAQNTSLSTVSLPVKLVLGENENMVLELRPTWADRMDDYEAAMLIGERFWSMKIGYRTLNSPSVSLHGPFAGFSLYY